MPSGASPGKLPILKKVRNSTGVTSFFRTIFPETKWTELFSADYNQVLQRLQEAGSLGSEAVAYIQKYRARLGFHEQDKSGAGWTLLRNITLAPPSSGVKIDLDNPYVLSLIIHEAFHLNQSILMRLSMRGELLAWQHQEQAYFELTGKQIGASGQAYPGTRVHWYRLMGLSAGLREYLEEAQAVTQEISPGYRSYCLPLYPLHQEIWYYLQQGKFKEAFDAIKNLVACK